MSSENNISSQKIIPENAQKISENRVPENVPAKKNSSRKPLKLRPLADDFFANLSFVAVAILVFFEVFALLWLDLF